MIGLEVLLWVALGAGMALAKLTLGSLESPRSHAWAPTLALASGAALAGGLVGLALMRSAFDLGDFNPASVVLAGASAAIALLVQGGALDRRSFRERPRS